MRRLSSATPRARALLIAGAAMVALWLAMGAVERELPAGSPGIIAFEFVGSEQHTEEMKAEWGEDGRHAVRLSLWIDYAFMVSYGLFVCLAGLATRDFGRRQNRRKLAAAGRVAPWLAVAAACFDAGENAGLLLALGGHGGVAAPVFATACASIKWTLITLAVAYVAWGLATRVALSLQST